MGHRRMDGKEVIEKSATMSRGQEEAVSAQPERIPKKSGLANV